MKYKAIIFDMDGTIIDSELIWQEAGHELIRRRNIHLSDEQKKELRSRLHGGALSDSCRIIKEFTGLPEPVAQLVQEKVSIAHTLYAQGISFIEGFLPFHQKAQQMRLKMAVATNGTADFVAVTDKVLNLSKLFGKHLYNMAHVSRAKPAPDVFLYAAQQLAVDPKQCIAIEDSAHGIHAAKEAGMFCIGINTSKTPEKLQQAHVVIDEYHEIELGDILGGMDNNLSPSSPFSFWR